MALQAGPRAAQVPSSRERRALLPDTDFFDQQTSGARRSAEAVVVQFEPARQDSGARRLDLWRQQ